MSFFREFTPFARSLAPDKPIMLAINSYESFRGAEETYHRELLPHLDIICPFGFHRMPPDDLSGEEAAKLMQSLCDTVAPSLDGCRELRFRNGVSASPANRRVNFGFWPVSEFRKILHYQFPGLMSSGDEPEAGWRSRREQYSTIRSGLKERARRLDPSG